MESELRHEPRDYLRVSCYQEMQWPNYLSLLGEITICFQHFDPGTVLNV